MNTAAGGTWSVTTRTHDVVSTRRLIDASAKRNVAFRVSREAVRPISVRAVIQEIPAPGDDVLFVHDQPGGAQALCTVKRVLPEEIELVADTVWRTPVFQEVPRWDAE